MSGVPMRTPPSTATLASIPKPALLYVNAKWCPHCVEARPVLQQVSNITGTAVPVYDVDSERNKKLISELGVKGFPTIIYRNGAGRLAEFKNMARTRQNIEGFVCTADQYEFCSRPRP